MHKRFFKGTMLLALCVAGAALSGCSQGKSEKKEVLETEVQETEAPEAEPQTEQKKEMTLKDVQISIPKTGRIGKGSFQMSNSTGRTDMEYDFKVNGGVCCLIGADGKNAYSDDKSIVFNSDNGWVKEDSSPVNLWDLAYSERCQKLENQVINNAECYRLNVSTDDEIGSLVSICYMNGYSDLVNGSVNVDFYISVETGEILRVDTSMPFMAVKGGVDVKGELSGSFMTTGNTEETIAIPEVEMPKEETSDYMPGEILAEQNAYQNRAFDIQVVGGEFLNFSPEKTDELNVQYQNTGSNYTEEAYGEGNGVILNISSIDAKMAATSDVMGKYLSDSKAENVQPLDTINIGTNVYETATAMINNTQTKTYCTQVGGRVLIATAYYTDENIAAALEESMYGMNDNPYWVPEEWVLEGKYKVTTPKGYSIIRGDSGDLFVCMKSSSDEINVFAIEDSSVDNEIAKETETTGDIIREVAYQDSVTLDSGSPMNYLVVKNKEPGYDYYTYVGLVQIDTATVKTYVVSTSANADYMPLFVETLNSLTSVVTPDEEIPTEDVSAEGEDVEPPQ